MNKSKSFATFKLMVTVCAFASIFSSGLAADSALPNILLCVADDHSYPHASAYGSELVNTPGFDRVARSGVLFHRAFASAPSCSPSRASILTGKPFFLTGSAAMNHAVWPEEQIPFTSLLKDAGYRVGFTGKGWGPGEYTRKDFDNAAGYEHNEIETAPPGEHISRSNYAANFEEFLADDKKDGPFFFWFGASEPHRPLDSGIGARHGLDPSVVRIPSYYPQVDEVRQDILDYAFEVEYYDNHLAQMLELLEERGELDNTLVIVTSDHGMAFPRAKANLYDAGMRVPLAMMWENVFPQASEFEGFVSLPELAVLILEAAKIKVPADTIASDLLVRLKGGEALLDRSWVLGGLERHGGTKSGNPDYPSRAYRTDRYLFIKNYKPENNPAGVYPGLSWPLGEPVGGFGNVDGSPTKSAIFFLREKDPRPFQLCLQPRPMYELYDLEQDPDQIDNLAILPKYIKLINDFELKLENQLIQLEDPRLTGNPNFLEEIRLRLFPRK
jgi:N-sulfoglucosamine sulfohydrolase